jgi:ribonuclease R
MVGERTGRVFQLAGRVRVTVARVDLETTKIDFTLAADTEPAALGAPSRPQYSEPLARGDRPAKVKPRR